MLRHKHLARDRPARKATPDCAEPAQPVTLKPGGAHIMLMGLNQPLQAGQSFPLTLTFEKAGQREVSVAVEKPGAMGPGGHAGGMQMPMPGHH